MDVTTDQILDGETSGNLTVASGATLTIAGQHAGPVEVLDGGTLVVTGTVRGPVTIQSLGLAVVTGDIVGRVEIMVAGTLTVETDGRIAGDVSNRGSFTNHGLRAGRIDGRAPDDKPGSIDVNAGRISTTPYSLPER